MVLGPVVAREQLGGAAAWGLIIASGATGMLVGALIAMRIRPRRPLRLAGLAMLADVVPFSLLALGGARVTVIITASFAGISLAIFQIVWQTALQEHVPQEELSRVTAWNWLGLLVFFPLGLVLAGPVSDVIGVTQTLWVSAATILVLVLIGLSVPSMRNLPSRAAEEAARAAGAARAGEAERSAEPVVRQRGTPRWYSNRRTRRAALGVLGEPEYRKLFVGQAVSVVGTVFTMVALPFAVLDLGGSATDIGLVAAANLVPLLVFLLVGGVWADRLPRQRVMLVADLCRAALQVVAAALLVSGTAHIWHLVLLQIALGTCEAFFRPAYTGLVPQTVSPERLQQANGLTERRQTTYRSRWAPHSAG